MSIFYQFRPVYHLRHTTSLGLLAISHVQRTSDYGQLALQRLFDTSSELPILYSRSKPYTQFLSYSLKPYTTLISRTPILNRKFHASSFKCKESSGERSNSEQQDRPEDAADSQPGQSKEKNEKSEEAGSTSDSKRSSEKEQPAPPPHGDKSPWQVFTETLRSEFKASKEWNESTKQLASSAHGLTESESLKRARAAYDATAGAATSKTADALRTTGKALGQSAAWTWDTKMVQGIRGGVNATGRGIEKATRPVRETRAFQNIKEAVDDGSSSRYGGWVEKEERRKKKELRDLKEVRTGRRVPEKTEEDPK